VNIVGVLGKSSHLKMYSYEIDFSTQEEADAFLEILYKSHKYIAGLDEVGRGPLCGDVVVACVILPVNVELEGITDSKKLSPAKRELLADKIMESCPFGIGVCTNEEIDKINIHQATHKAAILAYNECLSRAKNLDYLLCDGNIDIRNSIKIPSNSIIKGDYWVKCIGAASIVAKVYRDNQMKFYHDMYPEYGWNTNMGYPTKFHVNAIKKYGITPLHRKSFGICRSAKLRGDFNYGGQT